MLRQRRRSWIELDFILESGHDVMAVEVKSRRGRKAPSPRKVKSVFGQVNRRVVLARCNVYTDKDGIEQYPLFAACFVNELAANWDGSEFAAFNE